ncbi:hypothetical protein E2320_006706, partial [Naja naja]
WVLALTPVLKITQPPNISRLFWTCHHPKSLAFEILEPVGRGCFTRKRSPLSDFYFGKTNLSNQTGKLGHIGTTATKIIDVYLPLHTNQDKLQPMTVVTIANAKVQDLIGLICWQYTSEGREPKLNDNVSAYCLHIAEDDGEVDTDFPPLDCNEPIHKFGFSTLALVEKYSSPGLVAKQSLFVRM